MIKITTALAVLFTTAVVLAQGLELPYEDRDLAGPKQFFLYQFETNGATQYLVKGDGAGNIDCAVSTQDWRRLATDHSEKDGCTLVTFEKGVVILKIHNRGKEATVFSVNVKALEGEKEAWSTQ